MSKKVEVRSDFKKNLEKELQTEIYNVWDYMTMYTGKVKTGLGMMHLE